MDALSLLDGADSDAAALAKNLENPMVGGKNLGRTLEKRLLKKSSCVILTQLLANEIMLCCAHQDQVKPGC